MASKNVLLFIVIVCLFGSTLQDVDDNKVESKDESPLADVAKEILKEKNLENIGGMVNGFLQSGAAKEAVQGVLQNMANGENSGQLLNTLGNLLNSGSGGKDGQDTRESSSNAQGDVNPMDILSGIGTIIGALQGGGGGGGNPLLQGLGSLLGGGNNQGGGGTTFALLQGLGSLLASQDKSRKDNSDGSDILQNLGSIIGAAVAGNQNGGDNVGGALLQGLGSLLGGEQGRQGGINPEVIGNMINTFANSDGAEQRETKPSKSAPKKASGETLKPKKVGEREAKQRKGISNELDGLISLASSLLHKSKGKKGDSKNIDFNLIFKNLPPLLKLAKSYGGPTLKEKLKPIDDIVSIFGDVTDENKQFDFEVFLKRILNIYKELAPNSKSIGSSNPKEDSFDFDSIAKLASTFLNQGGTGNRKLSDGSSFMDYLPMIMNTINAFTGPEAQRRANSHAAHAWSLPPVLEKIHVYYDNFLNSDLGKRVFSFIGGQPTFKIFQDEKGNFSYDKFEELIENHSFRRHWIQQVVEQLVGVLQVLSDEKTYNQYVEMSITLTNSYLKKSGFPKKTLIDPKKPTKSITNFANYAIKKYFDTEFDTKEYVEPVVLYVQDLLKMTHKTIKPGAESKELADKLTNTINMEVIEPITRVNRAFRFAKSHPQCDKYVFCLVNQEVTSYSENLPSLKKGLYKSASLIAGWFISANTGTPYWDLYGIVTENRNCNDFYQETCSEFHEEEIRATTEYVHNEL